MPRTQRFAFDQKDWLGKVVRKDGGGYEFSPELPRKDSGSEFLDDDLPRPKKAPEKPKEPTPHGTDITLLGGICHALSTNWVLAMLTGATWEFTGEGRAAEMNRAMSGQRAYELYPMDRPNYNEWLPVVAEGSKRFVQQGAKHLNPPRTVSVDHNQHDENLFVFLENRASVLASGTGAVISLHGEGTGAGGVKGKWGHSVGLAHTQSKWDLRKSIYEVSPQSSFKFFDPNLGLFDWPADDASQQIAAELSSWLNEKYQMLNPKDVYLFAIA